MIRTYSAYSWSSSAVRSLEVHRPMMRIYGYVLFVLVMLVTMWESNLGTFAAARLTIPEESIRLRILAHSDAPRDQWIKRQVRDEIVRMMNGWMDGTPSLDEARERMRERLPEIEAWISDMLQGFGVAYGVRAELSVVPFPAEVYGRQLYPAGEYEALRVTLGSGRGQNWWCVLFPPLCFVDGTTGEASARETLRAEAAEVAEARNDARDDGRDETGQAKASPRNDAKADKEAATGSKADKAAATGSKAEAAEADQPQRPQVKFFLWEWAKKLIAWLRELLG